MPAPEGLQSFLIHSEHLFLSENADICSRYIFSDNEKQNRTHAANRNHHWSPVL